MDELLKTITSISWWVGVVIVGFLLNLLSAYAKSPLDAFLGGISRSWQRRSERSRAKRKAQIEALRSSEHLQILYLAREQRRRLQEIAWLAMACLFTLMTISSKILARLPPDGGKQPVSPLFVYFVGGMGLLCLLFALASRLSALKHMGLIEEAAFGSIKR